MTTTYDDHDQRRAMFFAHLVEAASRGRDNTKYDGLGGWLRTVVGLTGSAAAMGGLQRDFRKSVGQALSALPGAIVLLSPDSFDTQTDSQTYIDKLVELVDWAPRLRAVVACVGNEDRWRVEYLAGPNDSRALGVLRAIFPDASVRTVPVSPTTP